ncbi:MAG: DUF2231 domain-containing protein [Actinomycetota bacterium]|nr:DUF2231 domain-containing protein [Actinomycetota bacterium]
MPRIFSIKPSLTFKGRKFKGLRGWAGKPFHPPLTDIPVGAYSLAAMFDIISFFTKDGSSNVSHDFFVSATHVLIFGAIFSVPTALTGFWDWLKSTPKHTQAWRTANWHMAVMLAMSAVVIVDIVLRLGRWDEGETNLVLMLLSALVGVMLTVGATYGGGLVYEYGFNVETAGDHPVWHESERDVFPGEDKAIDA